jgi:hypothetical protein
MFSTIRITHWTGDDAAIAAQLVRGAMQAGAAHDAIAMRRAAALATPNAAKVEATVRSKTGDRMASLSATTGVGAFGAPSRVACWWARGSAGWQTSPIGPEAYNLEVLDEGTVDDCPGHLMKSQETLPRLWAMKPGGGQAVLGDQADAEKEAAVWAGLW